MIKKLPQILRYELTADDITCADACPTNCPHARAIKRKTGSSRVRVYGGRVSVVFGDTRYYYSAPTYTQKFEGVFDTGGVTRPGWATLRLFNEAKIQPVSDALKARTNKNRLAANAALRAQGETPKTYSSRVFTVTAAKKKRRKA